jgi:eukaryotic-like serine/threonine-protein kinase
LRALRLGAERLGKQVPTPPSTVPPVAQTPAPPPVSANQTATTQPFKLETFNFTTVTFNERGQIIKRWEKTTQQFVEVLGKGVKLEMVQVPGGQFLMGSPETEAERYDNEGPQHRVNVPPFFMGKYPITQAQWRVVAEAVKLKVKLVLDPEPSHFTGDGMLPVESVTWDEAVEFCVRLQQLTGKQYRLPSEAEWEYACRAGTETPFAFGPTITPEVVNYESNYPYGKAPKGECRDKTIPVGGLRVANSFGLFDLHGNVWEWCQDVWHDNYDQAPENGSAWLGSSDSSHRVLRGGSWGDYSTVCRAALRIVSTSGHISIGLRVVVSATTL